jgi:hypothetical protein
VPELFNFRTLYAYLQCTHGQYLFKYLCPSTCELVDLPMARYLHKQAKCLYSNSYGKTSWLIPVIHKEMTLWWRSCRMIAELSDLPIPLSCRLEIHPDEPYFLFGLLFFPLLRRNFLGLGYFLFSSWEEPISFVKYRTKLARVFHYDINANKDKVKPRNVKKPERQQLKYNQFLQGFVFNGVCIKIRQTSLVR